MIVLHGKMQLASRAQLVILRVGECIWHGLSVVLKISTMGTEDLAAARNTSMLVSTVYSNL